MSYADENYDEDYEDDNGDRLDGDYVYPNVNRLLQIAASMDHYDGNVGTLKELDLKDDHNLPEKYNMATELCTQFAQLERATQDPGTVMMMYEGMIFKTMWDLRLQTASKKKYKELAKFFMVGCVVLTGLVVYAFTR